MDEIAFLVEATEDGGYIARAINVSIFTEADNLCSLLSNLRDAVRCHFDEGSAPNRITIQLR